MPAPTKSFTVIPDSDVDPDSPVTTALMTALRDNDQHLEEWLGMSYTAAQNHDHDGTNSALAAITGQGTNRGHLHEIFDHFLYNVTLSLASGLPSPWTTSTYCGSTADEHYATIGDSGGNAGSLIARPEWQIEQAHAVLEFRARMQTSTDWQLTACGIGEAAGRYAYFLDEPTADQIRCQTVGSGGTETTDNIACNVDTWHTYEIDQSSSTQTVFSIDGAVVATHTTAVPDAVDIRIRFAGGDTQSAYLDYVKFYFVGELVDSAF